MEECKVHKVERNGFRFHFIPTDKFKTITLVLKGNAPLTRETVTKRALLALLLKQGTKRYPSEKKLREKLDELYGATLHTTTAKKGSRSIFHLQLEFANETYIPGEDRLTEEVLQLFHELLYEPNIEGEAFPNSIVEREKKRLENTIQAVYDNKIAYANQRLFDEMYKGEPFSLHKDGYVEDLASLVGENMYLYYKQMIQEDEFDLYVLGDFKVDDFEQKITQLFKRETDFKQTTTEEKVIIQKVENPKEIIETDSINQAKLHIGYRTNVLYSDEDYPALQVFNGLFGAFPNSKLFINVRERNSLAYYVVSNIESHAGLMLVASGIEARDYEKASSIIQTELDKIRKGDFSEDELENVKTLIINSVKETLDRPSGTVELLYQQVIGKKERLPEEFFKEIEQVTKEEVIAVSNKVNLDTIYLLRSEVGDEDGRNSL